MKFIEQLQRLERLDQLIRLKATGCADSLARRMDISRRTVYNLLEILRALGAEIAFCPHRQSFYYINDVCFDFSFGGFPAWDMRLYPQIYIPFIDEVDLTDQPTIVVGSEDGGDCIALGYKPIPGTNDYEVIEVDEDYARENLTWVISTNESVNERGELPAPEKTTTLRASGLQVRHTEYYVTSKKECWLCGDGELRVVWAHYDQFCNEIPGWIGSSGNLEGISKKELNAWHEIDNEYYLIVGGQPSPFPSNYTVAWVVYEYDNKPAVSATFPTPCGSSVALHYKSNDSYYGKYGTEYSSFFAGNSSYSEVQQQIPYGSQNFRILSRNRP